MRPLLTADQARLYELIWKRFLASQMAAAVFDVTTVDIDAVRAGVPRYRFRAAGCHPRFLGFMRLYREGKDDASLRDEERQSLPTLPPLLPRPRRPSSRIGRPTARPGRTRAGSRRGPSARRTAARRRCRRWACHQRCQQDLTAAHRIGVAPAENGRQPLLLLAREAADKEALVRLILRQTHR
jgi:hypothetical protein